MKIRVSSFFIMVWTLLASAGCATKPAPEPDPFAALEVLDVKIMQRPPPNAKFIAKIPYSTGSLSTNWQTKCMWYLRMQAVKRGGNVVVPGTELDVIVDLPHAGPYGWHETPRIQYVRPNLHFWSNIYYCPDYD